ncbi:MAG TPA: sigma-70 family RNA polymerase sigma factor [Candidatus Edwardsbacteria bacterium]|nr:sigma-70 family RNA polymerase sigma factor [Candidatus Edwardsbacteria bacterium]
MESFSDQQLIEQTLAGDNRAYNQLVTRYQRAVYALCRRMLRDHDLADEAAQEAFVKAFFALKQYDRSYRFYTWLSRIAFNLCCDELKDRKRTVPLGGAIDPPSADDPLESAAQSDATARIRGQIDRLPADQRRIVLLRVDKELSYEEIGAVLKVPPGTVMSRLYRARQALYESLKDIL